MIILKFLFLFILIIAIIAICALALFGACALSGFNDVKCPDCGEYMDFEGTDVDDSNAGLPYRNHYYYKCPHCGRTKVI